MKRAARGQLKVTASVSTFSPKPHTPFQWAAQLDIAETQARQALLRRELGRRGVEFRWHDSQLSWLEGVFARGDRRLADVIETAQRAGARFDGWSDRCRLDLWRDALSAHGLDAAFYLRRRPLGEVLPWEHLDAGVSARFLRQDLARAVEGRLTPDCSIERCTYCGACDFRAVRNVDYHPAGAKGSDHRGAQVSRWAELLVPSSEGDGLPEWETRTWRRIRTEVAARRAARQPIAPAPQAIEAAPLPAQLATGGLAQAPASGEGNAEEWLGAVPSSLAPAASAPAAVQRLRLRYRKIGPARFIGTRELGTVFERAARRAGLPVAFSRGHHPLPKLSFGPALPLGASSEDELLDIELTAAMPPAEARARLAGELPEGLELLGAVEIPRAARSIDQSVAGFRWEVDLADLPEPPASDVVTDAVARFRRGEPLPVRKGGKHGERIVDGRTAVRLLEATAPSRMTLELAVEPTGSVRPSAVVAALLGIPDDAVPSLRMHKVATRFHAAPDAAAVATSP